MPWWRRARRPVCAVGTLTRPLSPAEAAVKETLTYCTSQHWAALTPKIRSKSYARSCGGRAWMARPRWPRRGRGAPRRRHSVVTKRYVNIGLLNDQQMRGAITEPATDTAQPKSNVGKVIHTTAAGSVVYRPKVSSDRPLSLLPDCNIRIQFSLP